MSASDVTMRCTPNGSFESIDLETGTTHRIVVTWPVSLVRFLGPMYERGKCFVLPGALASIRAFCELHAATIGGEILVVGHNDASDVSSLTLARARSLAALLTDDVDAWLEFFSGKAAAEMAWGTREVALMLSTVPDHEQPYFSPSIGLAEAIAAFETEHGMTPSGEVSDALLRALIGEYMGVEGTSLPQPATVEVHGCGSAFPAVGDLAHGERMEIFIFHERIAPKPAGETSTTEYPGWLEAMTDEHRFEVKALPHEYLEFRLHDQERTPMHRAPFRIFVGGGSDAAGVSGQAGLVFVRLPAVCPEFVRIEWGDHDVLDYAYVLDVIPECSPPDPKQQDLARLNNLGYAPLVDLEAAVRQFQLDYRIGVAIGIYATVLFVLGMTIR